MLTKLLTTVVFLAALSTAPATATPVSLPIDPTLIGQPVSGTFQFNFSDLNGLALDGQAISLDVTFGDELRARLWPIAALNPILQIGTNAPPHSCVPDARFPQLGGQLCGHWIEGDPFWQSDPASIALLLPDGTTVPATRTVSGGGGSNESNAGITVAFSETYTELRDIRGFRFDFTAPHGLTVSTSRLTLFADNIQFGTATQLPEPSLTILSLLGAGGLSAARWLVRRRH
jgi:hypothetical protein